LNIFKSPPTISLLCFNNTWRDIWGSRINQWRGTWGNFINQ